MERSSIVKRERERKEDANTATLKPAPTTRRSVPVPRRHSTNRHVVNMDPGLVRERRQRHPISLIIEGSFGRSLLDDLSRSPGYTCRYCILHSSIFRIDRYKERNEGYATDRYLPVYCGYVATPNNQRRYFGRPASKYFTRSLPETQGHVQQ